MQYQDPAGPLGSSISPTEGKQRQDFGSLYNTLKWKKVKTCFDEFFTVDRVPECSWGARRLVRCFVSRVLKS
jgi:hypothetical protein